MQDFEKLGVFYLGKLFDPASGKAKEDLLLYDSKDLTTHAVCVGMTGSGKTGLCLALLEEAAIDGIPAIAIDPKGDLGNLLLTFPELKPADFRSWIDPAEATRRGLGADEFAAQTAKVWRDGLASWGQDPARIARFREAVDLAIYTPGSNAGLPLTVLRSFAAPPPATLENADALRERITAAVSGLLGLLGIDADPLRSREHILLSSLLDAAWRGGRDLDMATLIREIQQPPFAKIGFMDLESFYPAKERFSLAMSLNNLLASPGFSTWMEGEALDVQRLLYTAQGKPRLSIVSIAHLSDPERMFFVTILLNEVIAWMRSQSGTSSLRALLYMDEVFGYFPPTANPPAKTPMLTLLKQARAYGLGVVLATQNPVDLDYKGLSNAGTWFLGRLQTERDKARVLDGLEGASSAAGAAFDRQATERILSGLGNRVFLMNNVHDDHPVVFQTRWAMSYLRGPLTRDQIQSLMAPRKSAPAAAGQTAPASPAAISGAGAMAGQRPVLAPGVPEMFVAHREQLAQGESLLYRPALLGTARVHYAQASTGVDQWESLTVLTPVDETFEEPIWERGEVTQDGEPDLETQPAPASFAPLPPELTQPKTYAALETSLKEFLYRTRKLSIYKCAALKQVSKPGESEGDFKTRLAQAAREVRDLRVEKLKAKYAPKLATLDERRRRAVQRVETEKAQQKQATLSSAISFGSSVLGALFGRKLTSAANVTRAATSVRSASKILKERGDVGHAEETVAAVDERIAELTSEMQAEEEKLKESLGEQNLELEEVLIQPKKADVSIGKVALVWTPWRMRADGSAEELK
jgi:hypothetical protein